MVHCGPGRWLPHPTQSHPMRMPLARSDLSGIPSVRVLVLGDSGVGKTCLVTHLCTGRPVTDKPDWTVGCNVEVMVRVVGPVASKLHAC